MDGTELCYTPATELAAAIGRGDVSSLEAVEAVLERLERVNPDLNAFALVLADEARTAARSADAAPRDARGPLHGVPFTIKDMTPVAGLPMSFGSKAFVGHVSDTTSAWVERVLGAGAILVGKTTTSEFGNKALCESPLLGTTNNPWRTTHVSGGSSGGAAVAVAAGIGPLAQGGDAAGSIRVPASCCGVVGLKPSFGRVPIYPAFSSFETVIHDGPITRTVADAALMLQVMAGPDHRDAFSLEDDSFDFPAAVAAPSVHGLRIAYSRTFGFAEVEPAVLAATDRAAQVFADDLGANVDEVDPDVPDPREHEILFWRVFEGLCATDFVLPGLTSAEDMDPHLREMMELGGSISAWDFYRTMIIFRGELFQRLTAFFERYDLLLTPTLTVVPFPHQGGPAGPADVNGTPIERFAGWHLTYPFNLTGQPAVSVPCGFSPDGLPVGLQIAGPRHADAAVLRAAAAYEQAAPWAGTRPPL
jgi:Asp-tRNA(Asn)/Glu-tRNA(Gln) amidotransferase A subunit family amidase